MKKTLAFILMLTLMISALAIFASAARRGASVPEALAGNGCTILTQVETKVNGTARQKIEYVHDAFGHPIKVTTYDWDWRAEKIQKSAITECEYDENGRVSKETSYYIEAEAETPSDCVEFTYDANGNILSSTVSFAEDGKFVYTYRQVYTYDADNKKTQEITDYWRNNEWKTDSKITYTYEENKVFEVDYQWNSDENDFVVGHGTDDTFDENGNLISEISKSVEDIVNDEIIWAYESEYRKVYNDKGLLTQDIQLRPETQFDGVQNRTVMIPSVQTNYSYDESGRITSRIDLFDIDGHMIENSKIEYFYDDPENGDYEVEFYMMRDEGNIPTGWHQTSSHKTVEEKDEATGNLMSVVTYDKYSDEWEEGEGIFYTYEAFHRVEKIDEVAATREKDGVKEYYACACGEKFYSDAECKHEITNLEAWKKGEGRIARKANAGAVVLTVSLSLIGVVIVAYAVGYVIWKKKGVALVFLKGSYVGIDKVLFKKK